MFVVVLVFVGCGLVGLGGGKYVRYNFTVMAKKDPELNEHKVSMEKHRVL